MGVTKSYLRVTFAPVEFGEPEAIPLASLSSQQQELARRSDGLIVRQCPSSNKMSGQTALRYI